MDKGIVYVATGDAYQEECCISAKSVKNNIGNIDITVFTDSFFDCEYIDNVKILDDPDYSSLDFIKSLPKSPYERTIYFDTDIHVEKSVIGVYDLLDNYDLAVAHDTRHSNHKECPISGVPTEYPEFNTGVLCYLKNAKTNEFFNQWEHIYKNESDRIIDQPSFRAALYTSELNTVTLTPEYNCLYAGNPGYVHGPVRVFHGRLAEVSGYKGQDLTFNPEKIRTKLNSTDSPRVFIPHKGFKIIARPENIHKRFLASVRVNGLFKTLSISLQKISNKIK